MDDDNQGQLAFTALNSDRSLPTVLFIHGAFGAGDNWSLVTPHLGDKYHILLPDLPGHGNSASIRPFSTELSVDLLARCIEDNAKDGKAHVVGLSLGASVALALISSRPDLVLSAFVSGYNRFPNVSPTAMYYGMRVDQMVQRVVPRSFIKWLMDGTDLPSSSSSSHDTTLLREIVGTESSTWPDPWQAKTLIIVAGKKGLLPTADQEWAAVKLKKIAQTGGAECRVVTHPKMRHPWNRQDGPLFARAVEAWIERSETVEGFKDVMDENDGKS